MRRSWASKGSKILPSAAGRLFLVIDSGGDDYVGCLIFDDAVFCERLCEFLKTHRGMSIEAIGGLELPATFPDDAS